MALLGDEYASSDDGAASPAGETFQKTVTAPIVPAPDVSLDVWSHKSMGPDLKTNIV